MLPRTIGVKPLYPFEQVTAGHGEVKRGNFRCQGTSDREDVRIRGIYIH